MLQKNELISGLLQDSQKRRKIIRTAQVLRTIYDWCLNHFLWIETCKVMCYKSYRTFQQAVIEKKTVLKIF